MDEVAENTQRKTREVLELDRTIKHPYNLQWQDYNDFVFEKHDKCMKRAGNDYQKKYACVQGFIKLHEDYRTVNGLDPYQDNYGKVKTNAFGIRTNSPKIEAERLLVN